MAVSYKNIVITPFTSNTTNDPKIVFSGANTTVNTDITLKVYPDSNGSISFEGSAGQLFSITNDLSNSIFSVNDVSGLPVIDVNANSYTTITGRSFLSNSAPAVSISDTWNNATATFTTLKVNVTDTASNSASLLMDLQVGGTSQVSVRKDGAISCLSISGGNGNVGVFPTSAGAGRLSGIGLRANNYNLNIGSSSQIIWYNIEDPAGAATADLYLRRSSAAALQFGAQDTNSSATVTITIATPGVVTWNGHGLTTGSAVEFTTNGALPTGITAGTTYYVIYVGVNTFRIAASEADAFSGTAITTSGSQSGTHTGYKGAISQALKVQSVSAGVSNLGGSPLRIQGSAGTGNAAGGSIIFQVAPAGSSGSSQNPYSTALTISGSNGQLISTAVYPTVGLKSSDGDAGISYNVNGIYLRANGGYIASIAGSPGQLLRLHANTAFGWSAGDAVVTGFDLTLYRDSADTLALRRSTNAQLFRVYSTYTDNTTNAFGGIGAGVNLNGTTGDTNTLYIGSQKTGAPTALTKLAIQVDGTTRLDYNTTISASWYTQRDFYIAGLAFGTNKCYITSPSDNIITISNYSANDFNRLQFGGTTSAFPALKRSSTTIQVRLADDSGDAALQCGSQTSGATAFNVVGTGNTSIASITNISSGTLLQVLSSNSDPLMTVNDTTSGTIFSVQSNTAATLFQVNDTTSGTLLAVTNSTGADVFTVSDGGLITFGGTTSAFPALKRISSGNAIQVIAADNANSAGFIVGNQQLSNTATDGFLYVPTCNGTPTGTPTTQTGTAPIVIDTTNNKLYFYSGNAWRDAGP